MDKFDYCNSIIGFIKWHTGINFQMCAKDVLKAYYDSKGLCFVMPDYYGGDFKNDGWVEQDAIFYQIYSPTRLKMSLQKDIESKFNEDLEGLLTNLKKGKWNGRIKEFIFIVNTFDNNLPPDSDGVFKKIADSLIQRFDFNFSYKITNTDYLYDLLRDIDDIKRLESLSAKMNVRNYIDPNAITERLMIDFIDEISGKINDRFINPDKSPNEYVRVSTPEKISLNNLEEKRYEIENILVNLDVVEEAVARINQDILFTNKFNRVKEYIIERYNKESVGLSGIALYDKMINAVLDFSANKDAKIVPAKFLIVYIFDKCDIFEKEKR